MVYSLQRATSLGLVHLLGKPPVEPSIRPLVLTLLQSVAKAVVAQRFGPGAKSHPDMLGSFIRHGLSQEEAAGEALLQVVAGSDTSAGTLRAVMLNILTNPTTYKKLQAEIDDGIAAGKISSPIRDAEARQLPYLQAVIKEGLRIMPPASGAFFKEVPAAGDVIDGKFIPGGTQIGSSPLGIHRSKKIFGMDADLFRPERWIEASPEKFAKMASTVDLVFHYGKYQCLGKSVALMEFNKIFVEVSGCRTLLSHQKLILFLAFEKVQLFYYYSRKTDYTLKCSTYNPVFVPLNF